MLFIDNFFLLPTVFNLTEDRINIGVIHLMLKLTLTRAKDITYSFGCDEDSAFDEVDEVAEHISVVNEHTGCCIFLGVNLKCCYSYLIRSRSCA